MKKLNFKNRWVLVTGASSGLGREMALELALREEANLLITARRKQRLDQLKEEIERQKAVRVEIHFLHYLFSECFETTVLIVHL